MFYSITFHFGMRWGLVTPFQNRLTRTPPQTSFAFQVIISFNHFYHSFPVVLLPAGTLAVGLPVVEFVDLGCGISHSVVKHFSTSSLFILCLTITLDLFSLAAILLFVFLVVQFVDPGCGVSHSVVEHFRTSSLFILCLTITLH